MKSIIILIVTFLMMACARAPLVNPEHAMRKVQSPSLSDDLSLDSLLLAIKKEIIFLEKTPESLSFIFGDQVYTQEEYLKGLKKILSLKKQAQSDFEFYKLIQDSFDFYEVYGQTKWGEVFITTYYEPEIYGSLTQTTLFDFPVYRAPDDLLSLDLESFDPKYKFERKLRGRIDGKSFIPYYSREEIDEKKVLAGHGLELCWVNPVDLFFMQIQGSGTVNLGSGKFLYLNYADKNGHRFKMDELKELIKSKLPEGQKSNSLAMEAFLKQLPKSELQAYLNMNPSYVFFKVSDQRAVTYMGIPATNGRTIATDERYFPKGAIGFLSFEKPIEPATVEGPSPLMKPTSRFIIDQDIGGVIKGGGRVDLFLGRGQQVRPFAFHGYGKLYYLAPKR